MAVTRNSYEYIWYPRVVCFQASSAVNIPSKTHRFTNWICFHPQINSRKLLIVFSQWRNVTFGINNNLTKSTEQVSQSYRDYPKDHIQTSYVCPPLVMAECYFEVLPICSNKGPVMQQHCLRLPTTQLFVVILSLGRFFPWDFYYSAWKAFLCLNMTNISETRTYKFLT